LIHLVRKPVAGTASAPVLVLLHGVGSHEGDLFGLADQFPDEFLVVSVRAPLTLRPGSYAWFPVQFTPEGPVADSARAEESRKTLVQFLAWVAAEYHTDPTRVVVVGFSQGAIMAASLALTVPEKIQAAVLMSGRILPEAVSLTAPLPGRLGPRYLIVHGTSDDRLPIAHGRASREALRSLGIEPDYREFAMGHTITDESLAFVRQWVSRIPTHS
jgi:phospholipase/carboxylesterase